MSRVAKNRVRLSLAGLTDPDTVRRQLSSVVRVGEDLFLGTDEGAALVRVSPVSGFGYGAARSFALADLIDLPGGPDDEIDIEGLDFRDGWLWVTGSHSARRGKPDEEEDAGDGLRRLARVKRRGNRYLLARVPMSSGADGRWEPLREEVAGPGGAPRRAARLSAGPRKNALTRSLRDDRHLAPFLEIPGKENGLDVEGLAVTPERVFLGLRGPVLRGWAVVLSLAPDADPEDPSRLRLGPVAGKKRGYAKHFLDLRGLGVRELVPDGEDLLVLAGPTMELAGRAAVFRWRGGARAEGDSLVPRDALEHVLDLPYGRGDEAVDRPEGLARVPRLDGGAGLLVVCDSPHPDRLHGEDAVDADLYPLG